MRSQEVLKKSVAEAVGTAFLLAAVVGSGIMAEKLSGGNVSLALLENTLATGAALVALILCFGPISGAHFNPAVTLADATQRGIAWNLVPVYILAQCVGGICGVYAASYYVRSATAAGIRACALLVRRSCLANLLQRSACWLLFGDVPEPGRQPFHSRLVPISWLRIGSRVRLHLRTLRSRLHDPSLTPLRAFGLPMHRAL
jgi:hypothetical protein